MPLRKLPGWLMTLHPTRLKPEIREKVVAHQSAIQRALADSESGNGWGPDVTVCAYFREALTACQHIESEHHHPCGGFLPVTPRDPRTMNSLMPGEIAA